MISQKDIAERAGVSRATVSRAFTQNANIRPETLAKIQNAMKSFDLEPISWLPDSSKTKSKYVLVMACDIADDFYSQIIKGICDRLAKLGLFAVVCNSNYDSQTEENYIKAAQDNHFMGIILVTAVENITLVELLRNITIPVILVNRYIRSLDMDIVCIDNYRGGYMATEYLIQNGHKKIAHLAGHKNSTAPQDRVRGYIDAVQDAGHKLNQDDIYYGDQTREGGREFAEKLINKGLNYTAIFVANWHMALGAAECFIQHGYEIPEDISIICFDDSPFIDERGLNLTTISYAPYPMGSSAVDTLLRRVENPLAEKSRLLLTPRLTLRSSVAKIAGSYKVE